MKQVITVKNLKCPCVIGVYPQERKIEQILFIDIELRGDFTKATLSDCVDDTIDYASVAQETIKIAQVSKSQLIEHLARKITAHLFSFYAQLSSCSIKIKKTSAIPETDYASFSMECSRSDL